MDGSLAPADALRYEKLKKAASTEPLAFRAAARQYAAEYPRSLRHLIRRASTKDTSVYALFMDWTKNLLPQIELLAAEANKKSFVTELSTRLQLSQPSAAGLVERLAIERQDELREDFLTLHYGIDSRARNAAATLLYRSPEAITVDQDRYINHLLYQRAAADAKLAIYDAEALLPRRVWLRIREYCQVRRYGRQQTKRLRSILGRQQEIKAFRQGVVGRILALEFDTVVAIGAYRNYKKRLDALKSSSKTPAKTLSLFTAATKAIREEYASKLTSTDKLADLQNALKEVDAVLVEVFDMTDRERNTLMAYLKEYRDLDREAGRITKEHAAHFGA